MDTSIVEQVLSDGSKVYNVVFVDGSYKTVIGAESLHAAEKIQDALSMYAVWANIDPNH